MLKSILRLIIKSQSATSGPPLGPALGQFGVPTMDFCKRFNELSKTYEKGVLLNTIIHVKFDRTYEIFLKGPPISFLIKNIIEMEYGLSYSGYFNNLNILISNYMLYELFNLTQSIHKKTLGHYKTIKGTTFSCGFHILNYELEESC
jgi:large subunit ribosomal protein L11